MDLLSTIDTTLDQGALSQRAEGMWMMMKVIGDLKGLEHDFDECCGVEFCFVCHCGHL